MSGSHRHYCTYFDRNYLAKGLALIESLERHETSDFTLHVVCLDELTRTILDALGKPHVRTTPLHAIERGDDALVEPRRTRTLVEYYWTLTPTVILRLLEGLPEGEVMTYLDADLFFYSSPDPIFAELGARSVLIHEHRYSRSMSWLAENGRYNVGLLCFRHDARGLETLRYWRERCIEWCFKKCEGGKMGDQCYLDDWTERFPGVVVLQHVGAGLGPWNHDSYQFARDANGAATVDGEPVVFYHFHSFTVVTPELFMPVGSAYHLTRSLLELVFAPYAEAVRRSIDAVRERLPTFAFGITHPGVSAEQVLLARPEVAPVLQRLGVPHARSVLSRGWELWASPQLVDEGSRALTEPARRGPPTTTSASTTATAPSATTPAAAASAASPTATAPNGAPTSGHTAPSPGRIGRDAVLARLERDGLYAPLVAALRDADRALAELFAATERTTGRAILLGLVATALEGRHDAELAEARTRESLEATADGELEARAAALAVAIRDAAARDDLDAADAFAAELSELMPENPDVSMTLGHLALRRNSLRTAQNRFLRASVLASNADASVRGDVADAFVELARSWLASGEPEFARLDLGRAVRLVPGHAEAQLLAASLDAPAAPTASANAPAAPIAAAKVTPAARPAPSVASPARVTLPTSIPSLAALPTDRAGAGPSTSTIAAARAAASATSRSTSTASPSAATSSTGAPSTGVASNAASPDPATLRRTALFEEGERLAARGEWPKAHELFGHIAREYRDFAPGHVGLASASLALGLVDEGHAALDRACELAPGDLALHVRRGALLLQTDRVGRATECFRALVARHPESVEARLGLAECHRLARSPLEAIEVLDLAHRAFPSEPAFVAAIGTLAAELGDRSGAARALEALESFAPDHPRTLGLRQALGADVPRLDAR